MGRRVLVVVTAAAMSVALGAACSGGGKGGAATSTAVTFAPAGQGGPTSTPSQTVTVPASDASSTPPSTAPPAKLPASVDPGTGVLVVGAESVSVGITLCNLTPETDPATGVTTNVLVTGDDGEGGTLTISQRQTAGGAGATTITETVSYARGGSTVEASRIKINGAYHDLRDPSVSGALLEVNGNEVRASGTFGSPGSVAGDPSLASGAVLARCSSP